MGKLTLSPLHPSARPDGNPLRLHADRVSGHYEQAISSQKSSLSVFSDDGFRSLFIDPSRGVVVPFLMDSRLGLGQYDKARHEMDVRRYRVCRGACVSIIKISSLVTSSLPGHAMTGTTRNQMMGAVVARR